MLRILDSNRHGPTTKGALAALEARLGFSLPPDYRHFLLDHNGGTTEPDEFDIPPLSDSSLLSELFGLHGGPYHASLERRLEMYKDRLPRGFVPIGVDEGGNLICISASGPDYGAVFFWDHESEQEEGETPNRSNLHRVSDSFEEFLQGLH